MPNPGPFKREDRSRRRFLGSMLATLGAAAARLPVMAFGPDDVFVGTVPLEGTRPGAPLGRLLGTGLDARLFTDLSTLAPDASIVPNDRFYIRTSAPAGLPAPWSLTAGGLVRARRRFTFDDLARLSAAQGVHLMECAGNSDPSNFGLMSAANWDGVPVAQAIDRLQPASRAWRVRVSGRDPDAPSATSIPGASWIFARSDLERTGAFFAIAMNGAPLSADHGSPVRLVVPGWYGCCAIKWVDALDLVPDDTATTDQMREFATRTHHTVAPDLAREYEPPAIDHAAMPIRVEKWSAGGRLFYRVIGIQWGGDRPTRALAIRFRSSEPFVPVEQCALPPSTATWSFWSHTWRPTEPRRYEIVLKVTDPSIRTRRLDLYFYTRAVMITEGA